MAHISFDRLYLLGYEQLNTSDECLWKWQNLNKCPDVWKLCPSSVECSLRVAPRFLVLNFKFNSCVLHAHTNFRWSEKSVYRGRAAGISRVERWDAFPASSSVCSRRRVWSRGPERRLWYVILISLLKLPWRRHNHKRKQVQGSNFFLFLVPVLMLAIALYNNRSGITQAQGHLPHVVMFGQWKQWIQLIWRLNSFPK